MRTALIAVIALAAIAIPTSANTATTANADTTAVQPIVISITAVNGRIVGGYKKPIVKKGRLVRFVIRTNVGTEIHLHGYDIEKKPRKGVPTVIQFVAKLTGRFDLELHHPDVLLARLTVKS